MKKWTYLVAALLTLGSTSVLTGCIDNDEPAGISTLRTAKAELIAAKKAVEEAKAAERLANAALIQAKVKTEEANAAKIQAEAEVQKAEAAIKQAQADYWAAQTETQRAQAQKAIEENERAQKQWEENAAVRAAEAEQAIVEAELAIATAKANYQVAIAQLIGLKQSALTSYVTDLDTKTTAYYNALDELIKAQRELNDQQAVVDEREANKEFYTRGLQKKVTIAESALAGEQEKLEKAEKELEVARTLEASELAGKYEEYKTLKDQFQLQIADLSVEAAEKIYELYTSGRMDEVDALWDAYYAYFLARDGRGDTMKDQLLTWDAVTMDHGDGKGLPENFQQGVQEWVSAEENGMTRAQFYYSYETGLQVVLENIVEYYRDLTRDANDNEWTKERISYLEALLKDAEEQKKVDEAAWNEAVAAYNAGKYNNGIGNYQAITGYTELSTALAAFNEEIADLSQLDKDIKAYQAARTAAATARTEARTAANQAYAAAYAAAAATYNQNRANRQQLYDTKKAALKKIADDAQAELAAASKAVADFTPSGDNDADAAMLAALIQIENNKQTAYDDAAEAHRDYSLATTDAEIQKIRDDAEAAADATHTAALNAADKAYSDAWNTTNGTEYLKLTAAQNEFNTRKSALHTDFGVAVEEAIVAYNESLPELNVDATPQKDTDEAPLEVNKVGAAERSLTQLTEASLFVVTKSDLTEVVLLRSQTLYGTGHYANKYGDFEARLVALPDADIKSELSADETITSFRDYYIEAARRYGSAGQVIALKAQIELANTWLNNGDQIKALIAQAEQYLADFDALYEEIETTTEDMLDAYNDAVDKLNADKLATLEPIEAKQAELRPLKELYNAYEQALKVYINTNATTTQTDLEAWIKTCKTQLESAQTAVYDAETKLMRAQKNLDEWNAGALSTLELKQRAVEDAQTDVDRAKEAMDKAQAALDAAVALFETAE